MASLRWPPDKTFRYEFNEELTMEIPAIDNKELKSSKSKNDIKDRGMDK